jgi:ligand-binding sensor domain-containing protein
MKAFCLIISLLISFKCFAQSELNFIQYTTKEGLPSNMVYDVTQDKDGFIWFGTENGLCRFDGKYFKTFTIKDGLPDNEILKVIADSGGRVWIMPFNNKLCYYYNGTIYNETNDTILKSFNETNKYSSFNCFYIDKKRNLYLDFTKTIYKFNGERFTVFLNKDFYLSQIKTDQKKLHFYLFHNHQYNETQIKIFNTKKRSATITYDGIVKDGLIVDSINPYYVTPYYGSGLQVINSDILNSTKVTNRISSSYNNEKGLVIFILDNGIDIYFHNSKSFYRSILKEHKINSCFQDDENIIWIVSNNGVFKLLNPELKVMKNEERKEIFSLSYNNSKVIIGKQNSLGYYANNQITNIDLTAYNNKAENILAANNRALSQIQLDNKTIIGFDRYLLKYEDGRTYFNNTNPCKSISKINNDKILVGTGTNTVIVDVHSFKTIDTIWYSRSTSVAAINGQYYIGSLNGLHRVSTDKTATHLADIAQELNRRIVNMQTDNKNQLWVATADMGVVVLQNEKVVKRYNEANGLSSNQIKTIYLQDSLAWIGTVSGLNKININNNTIVKYSMSDGLPSNIINAITIVDSLIYVGTPEGLAYFNEKQLVQNSMCKLHLLQVKANDSIYKIDSIYTFPPFTKNIHIEFTGISHKSAGEIVFYYKLDGLDTSWQKTNNYFIDYPTLPSGNYTLLLKAVNKYGVESEIKKINISILKPWFKKNWFIALVVLLLGLITYLIIRNRIKKALKKQEEINTFNKRLSALEQSALQAQMNPHFIFNCLNSIQQFVVQNDVPNANKYLSLFAVLLRQTLNQSSSNSITLKEEIAYLNNYLQMEKLRFTNRFNFTIENNVTNPEEIELPAMLLQPFVENAIRHGLATKTNEDGNLLVQFILNKNILKCIIQDDGIGRVKAAELKSKQHIEYQSKGMNLTIQRIELLNKTNNYQIQVEINDLYNSQQNAIGTQVVITIPQP